jgi:hypothetical protein
MNETKRSRSKSDARNPILEQVLSENSSIVLDVAKRMATAKDQKPLFACRSLNATVIFKMPNFSVDEGGAVAGADEWDLSAQLTSAVVSADRPVETGIFIPYSLAQREAGGVVLYVRQRNFEALMREFLGVNYQQTEGPTKRDQAILEKIDGIPSLDPFLLKQALYKEFPDIDAAYFNITDAEDKAVRDTISRKVMPIVQKALQGGTSAKAGLGKFVDAIWNPAAPEATLFVSAFGISASQTQETFEAWRGITYYEWSYGRIIGPIGRLLGWYRSERSKPTDGQRIGASMRQQLEMLRVSSGRKLSAQARAPDQFFRDYAMRHAEFVDKNDPSKFREFLRTAGASYWQLGWSITALTHVIGIFSRAAARGADGCMTAETLFELYRDIDLALMKNQTKLVADG